MNLVPQAFPGEHIGEYFAKGIFQLAEPLMNDGQYPQELTLAIIAKLLTPGGDTGHPG
jgi:hypothetical protein